MNKFSVIMNHQLVGKADTLKGDRIVEDTELALKRHVKNNSSFENVMEMLNDDTFTDEEMYRAIKQGGDVQPKVKPHFSGLWVAIHIILAIFTGGVSILTTTLPWVVAKYQTNDNVNALGIILFSWLYNIYRFVK